MKNTKMIKLTIDGRPVEVAQGATILEAARTVGIDIPTLCYHEWVSPIGSCRMCVVKVDGYGIVASCNTPAADGLVVTTDDDELHRLRKQQLELILLNHPLDCPICDKAGECRLQDLTYAFNVSEQPFHATMEKQTVDTSSWLIERTDSRCVRCGRCVAVCEEVMGVGAYTFDGRGYAVKINTHDGGPLDCEFCGQCVAICPVGALLAKGFKHRARVWDLARQETVCGYCGAGCQLELNVRRNRVYRVTSDRKTTSNDGLLCVRGTYGNDYFTHENRRHSPMVKRDGHWVEIGWPEALDSVAEGIKHALATGGPEAVGVLASPRLPLEDAYLTAYVFGDVVGTRLVAVSGQDGYGEALKTTFFRLGRAGSTADFDDLGRADAILLLGSDLAAEMPVPHLRALRAVRENDARLINAYPTPTKCDDFATSRLRYHPGEETAVLLMLLRCLVEQKGQSVDFIMRRTEGFAAFKAGLDRLNLDDLAWRSGISIETAMQAAAELARAKAPVVVLGNQSLGSPMAGQIAGLAIDLLMALGRVEHGLLLSSDRSDVFGAMLAGLAPGRGPGLKARENLPVGWTRMPEAPGLGYRGVLEAGMVGHLSALIVLGANPLVGTPMAEPLRKAMDVTGFVVTSDPFLNATAEQAQIYLPTQTFAEREGLILSVEGRLLNMRRAIEPAEGAMTEWQILLELAKRLGKPYGGETLHDIRRELAANVADLTDVDYETLPRSGQFIPRFALGEDTKITFGAIPLLPSRLEGDLLLVTGPVFAHNGTLSQRGGGPMTICPEPWLALHPDDAREHGLSAGASVKVRAQNTELSATVRYDDRLSRGTAFAPHHFAAFPVGYLLAEGPCAAIKVEK